MSGSMNSRQAQVIDPILSTVARGYINASLISYALFPLVMIPNRSMKVVRFGKDAFRRYVDTRRAPGAPVKRVQFGYSSDPVSLRQEALAGLVPVEIAQDAARVPGIDLGKQAIETVQNIIALNREVETATLARDPANYAASNKLVLSGSSRWSSPDSDPGRDLREARNAVRLRIGRDPNTLVLGPRVFDALAEHEKIKEQFKYTSNESLTEVMLAKYFNIERIVVGKAVALPENATDDDPAVDIWGDDAILAYVPSGSNLLVPAYGYTYTLEGYPAVEEPYYDRDIKSWVYPTAEEYRPYIVGSEAGFLFQKAAE